MYIKNLIETWTFKNSTYVFLGVKDYSGMRFIVTQELRPHDAGIMELGLIYTDKMAIPPNQHRFPLHGYCLPQCSAVVSFLLVY